MAAAAQGKLDACGYDSSWDLGQCLEHWEVTHNKDPNMLPENFGMGGDPSSLVESIHFGSVKMPTGKYSTLSLLMGCKGGVNSYVTNNKRVSSMAYQCKAPQTIHAESNWNTAVAAVAIPTTNRVRGETNPVFNKPDEPPTHQLGDKTWTDLGTDMGATKPEDQGKLLIHTCIQY